jgi:RNA polymerase sigma-B factor
MPAEFHVSDATPESSSDRLIVDYLPLARALALRYRDRGEPVEDLVQVAYLALVKASRRYCPERGQSFAAYAAPTITGELRRHFRDHGWDIRPPRRLQELQTRLRSTENDLAQTLGRPPTSAELAQEMDVPEEEVQAALTASRGYTAASLEVLESEASEALGNAENGYEEVMSTMTLRPLLAGLAPRDRRIIALRYFHDATQAEIGREIGVTQMQVSRLLRQAVSRLRAAAGVAA